MLRGFGGQAEATRARARQGAVLFVALLILLWVPLLIFSSSAIPAWTDAQLQCACPACVF